MSLVAFVAAEAIVRRKAVEALAPDALATDDVAFALRRLLASDPDVAVRALAAGALGRASHDATPWLVDALGDRSPVVRDAAVRAIARRGAPSSRAAFTALCELSRTDLTWFVRRGAIYALGVIGGANAIAPARAALADPFWRVRHAAVQVLAVCGSREPARKPEILADVVGGTGEYLGALWGPTLISDAAVPAIASRLPPELLDRDPAVVTARLAALPAPLGAELTLAIVELLCDPHVPLRELAARRLLEAHDLDAFAAALNWLDEPRIPHVAATVIALLDGLGDPARILVERALTTPSRRGAARWAIGWVVATRDAELAELAWRRAEELDARELAMPLAPVDELAALLADELGPTELLVAAADELMLRPADVRAKVVASTPLHRNATVRLRLVAAGHRFSDPLLDHDPLVRAAALELAGPSLPPHARAAALADLDPAVREAVVPSSSASDLAALLATERDPWVRRAASHALVQSLRGGALVGPRVALSLTADADDWIRACACELLDVREEDHAARIGALASDPSPMVQAAIVDVLARLSDAQLASLATEGVATWIAAGADETDPAFDREEREVQTRAPRRNVAKDVARRRFGRSGVTTSSLVISGAFDLQPGSLRVAADAGVDTLFWEPSYAGMTRFIRSRREMQIVAGSYHADAASITRDVETALRRLQRETLDVFLLFWARSEARLDHAAFAAMQTLQRAGKVRAIGFSTHDRGLAMQALAHDPWDVVMTRHSAAHPGIEDALLAAASAAGAGVLTFSALCYGRMVSGQGAPSPADCYRYSLAQQGVTACISAPRRHRELVENLAVVAQPALTVEEQARVRTHGAGVRVESQRFNTLIRQPTRDAAAAAMAMLEAELVSAEEIDAACVTPAALQRSLHSRGRGRASLLSAMLRRGRL